MKESKLNSKSDSSSELWQYDRLELVKLFSALSIIPENHGKNKRLEHLTLLAIQNAKEGIELDLKDISKHFQANNSYYHSGDPTSNLFTDLIIFYGGDYIIFPGITENSNYFIINLLRAIFFWPDSGISHKYLNNIQHATTLLLLLSNKIATALGYTRYMKTSINGNEIEIPDKLILDKISNSILYTEGEMLQFLKDNRIASDALNEFVVHIDDLSFLNGTSESPLVMKPILKCGKSYIIASPTTFSFALSKFILKEAINWNCQTEVITTYHNFVHNDLQLSLKQLGFKYIDLTGVASLKPTQKIYRFDDDKIALIEYIGQTYNESNISKFNKKELPDKSEKTTDIELVVHLLTLPQFQYNKILRISIFSNIGNDFLFTFDRIENAKSIGLAAFELYTLSKIGKFDAIDVWNFTQSVNEREVKWFGGNFSFLDQIQFFREHSDSFYSSDEVRYDFNFIFPGYANKLIVDAKLSIDEHSALLFHQGKLVLAPVVKKDDYAPIYFSHQDLGSDLRLLVEGYSQPIWITCANDLDKVESSAMGVYIEITDAIAYWFWQLTEYLNDYIAAMGEGPITINFKLNPPEEFEKVIYSLEQDPDISNKFKITVSDRSLLMIIPCEINAYFYSSKNEGDRILVYELLKGINLLLNFNQLPLINESKLINIIDQAAPLGQKKKYFILDTNDNLLTDPRNLPPYRYVQDYNISKILDLLGPALGSNRPPIGEISLKKDKEKLTRDIVIRVLLPMLSATISNYNAKDLLERLLGLNESLIHRREQIKILTPSRIACFVSPEQQVQDLKKEMAELNITSIAVRCLIEHVAAEQVYGREFISNTAIDELVALMDQIINWGTLGDQIAYDLFDIKMGILPTGRIGTEKQKSADIFDPYYESKTKEDVEDLVKLYHQVFIQRNPIEGKETPEYLDNAFHEEYGISFNRICEFIDGLIYIGLNQPTVFASIKRSQLRQEINKTIEQQFEEEEFNNALKYLSLEKRGKVATIPEGYDSFDISPWRFNRRLSLLRKPVILLEDLADQNDPLVYWGFRQVLSSRIYLADQIITSRLKVDPDGAIIKALGKFSQDIGTNLVTVISKKLFGAGNIIDTEVTIGPKGKLHFEKDIGDIDVLIIDKVNKVLFSLECKKMAPSRNIKEMVEEVAKLMGSNTEKGWIKKHEIRHEWIKENLKLIGEKYDEDLTGYQVRSFMVTYEGMLTPYLKKHSISVPFVTRYEIIKDGMDALRDKENE